MNYVYNILDHPKREIIEKRLRIIEFFDKYGPDETDKYFHKKRSTIYLWKQNINKAGGKLSALAPGDKAPKTRSKRKQTPAMIKFIMDYRLAHPGCDQVAIKPHLDEFCRKKNLPLIGEATIGKIIRNLKDKGEIPDFYIRTTIEGKTGKLKYRKVGQRKKKKLRVGDYVAKAPGDLVQVDAITLFYLKTRRYIVTAIDLKTKFAFAYCYKTLSSSSARDFMQKLETVTPFPVKAIQTDNGAEFAKHFDDYLTKRNITHFFSYPHYPKANTFIENFNGLIQRQYVGWHMDELDSTDEFNKGLIEYLVWYNSEKPHRALGKIPPLLYYVDKFIGPQKSNMLVYGAKC